MLYQNPCSLFEAQEVSLDFRQRLYSLFLKKSVAVFPHGSKETSGNVNDISGLQEDILG